MTQLAQEVRGFASSEAREHWTGAIAREGHDIEHAPRASAGAAQRYLLVFQFAVVNLAAFALLGAAYPSQLWLIPALYFVCEPKVSARAVSLPRSASIECVQRSATRHSDVRRCLGLIMRPVPPENSIRGGKSGNSICVTLYQ